VLQIKIYSILHAEVVKRAEPKVVGAEMRNKPWVLYCARSPLRSEAVCAGAHAMVYMT
jgi:hypothetical protein